MNALLRCNLILPWNSLISERNTANARIMTSPLAHFFACLCVGRFEMNIRPVAETHIDFLPYLSVYNSLLGQVEFWCKRSYCRADYSHRISQLQSQWLLSRSRLADRQTDTRTNMANERKEYHSNPPRKCQTDRQEHRGAHVYAHFWPFTRFLYLRLLKCIIENITNIIAKT